MLNDPQLLIADEPTAGLDPEERVRFRNLLADLSGERIIILSTHDRSCTWSLPESAVTAEWEAGRSLALEQTIELALSTL